jgi:hypothetical protein
MDACEADVLRSEAEQKIEEEQKTQQREKERRELQDIFSFEYCCVSGIKKIYVKIFGI